MVGRTDLDSFLRMADVSIADNGKFRAYRTMGEAFVWAASSFDLDHREWRRVTLVGLLVERLILVMLHRAPRRAFLAQVQQMNCPARRPFGQRATA